MKKLAARDFEDILQCSYAAFEGLLPPMYNTIIMKLIFVLATWHAFAKLRLHSETTITFEDITRLLGATMRAFVHHVCPAFDTKELPKETHARQQRATRSSTRVRPSSSVGSRSINDTPNASSMPKGPRYRVFNLKTYKYHRLGDYPAAIRMFGTTDNFSTQTGELEHRRVKKFYSGTNKGVQFAWQIANHQRREAYLQKLQGCNQASTTHQRTAKPRTRSPISRVMPLQLSFNVSEPLGSGSPKEHHQISEEQAQPLELLSFLAENQNDPSYKNVIPQLHTHIYHRLEALAGRDLPPEPSRADLRNIRIARNRLYLHKVMSHADIMMLAPSGATHPYLYAHVIAIFHVNVYRITHETTEAPEPDLLHVLWVRWYDLDTTRPSGFDYFRPHRVQFAGLDEEPFGFISPQQVLRAVHIQPVYAYKRSSSPSLPYRQLIGSESEGDDEDNTPLANNLESNDWKYYYIGMWTDRDLFMRYLGGAPGHAESQDIVPILPGPEEEHRVDASDLFDPSPPSGSAAHLRQPSSSVALQAPTGRSRMPRATSREPLADEDGSDDEDPDRGYYPSEWEDVSEDGEDGEGSSGNNRVEDDGEEEPNLGPEDGEDEPGLDGEDDVGCW